MINPDLPDILSVPLEWWLAIISALVSALMVGVGRIMVQLRKQRTEERERAEDRESQRKATENLRTALDDAAKALHQQLRDEVHERRNQAAALLSQTEVNAKTIQGLQAQLTQARNDITVRDRTILQLRSTIERLRRSLARHAPHIDVEPVHDIDDDSGDDPSPAHA